MNFGCLIFFVTRVHDIYLESPLQARTCLALALELRSFLQPGQRNCVTIPVRSDVDVDVAVDF